MIKHLVLFLTLILIPINASAYKQQKEKER